MMRVDDAHAAVAVDVVAAEKQFAQAERQLAVGVAGRMPDFQFEIADVDRISVVHEAIDLDRRHVHLNVLGRNVSVSPDGIGRGQNFGRLGDRLRVGPFS